MSKDTAILKDYFSKLGLEASVAELYVALYTYGPQTISELSRNSGVERTRIYRLIDVLKDAHLVEIESHYKRHILKAAPVGNLQILLSKKEEDLRRLQAELKQVQNVMIDYADKARTTRVQSYQGVEGVKQMFWNETRSKTENQSILFENMQSRTNSAFFERWVRRFNANNIKSRAIVGDHFLTTQKQWYKSKDNERIAAFEARYAPKTLHNITHSTVVYDDVVAYYSWHEGNIFGIEIYNQDIADAQRTFFEMLWAQSQPMPKTLSQQLSQE